MCTTRLYLPIIFICFQHITSSDSICPHFYKWLGTGASWSWVEKQQTRNWPICTPITKHIPKWLIILSEPKKVEGHNQNKNFAAFRRQWSPVHLFLLLTNGLCQHQIYICKFDFITNVYTIHAGLPFVMTLTLQHKLITKMFCSSRWLRCLLALWTEVSSMPSHSLWIDQLRCDTGAILSTSGGMWSYMSCETDAIAPVGTQWQWQWMPSNGTI